MAITPAERRFIRSWEEQRREGRRGYMVLYTFAYTIVTYISAIALGLFFSVPFIKLDWLAIMGILSLISGFAIAQLTWRRREKHFKQILRREIGEQP